MNRFEFDCASVPQAFIPTRVRLGLESSLTVFSGILKPSGDPAHEVNTTITLTASGTVHASINAPDYYLREYTAVGETSSLPPTTFVGGTEVA